MAGINRREFVIATGTAAACACAGAGGLCESIALAAPPAGKIDVGTVADYPSNVISEKFVKPNKLLIVRSGDRIYAMNAVCTHKACVVKLKDGQLRCPCHGSTFTEHGTVNDGPAKVSLFRYRIELNKQGRLIVDKSKQFGERHWDERGSFVTVS